MARTVVTEELWNRFHAAVNMPSRELLDFVGTSQELADYQREPGIDLPVVGHHVAGLLSKRRTDVTDADEAVMRLVIELIEARLANPPADREHNDAWRHGLMMLGHDPLAPAGEPPG